MPEPAKKRTIKGTQPTTPPPATSTGTPLRGNPEVANRYYQNVVPAMQRLIGNKHDEVYTDPANGTQCNANSCLSFATTVFDQASGSQTTRSKQNLYDPEFTRTSEQQWWGQIPIPSPATASRVSSQSAQPRPTSSRWLT